MRSLTITQQALEVLARVRKEEGEDLLFMLGGGCCDNTAPMLLKDFRIGATDVRLGEVCGVPVYCEREQAKLFADYGLEIGLTRGGSNSFSLETPQGVRFVLRSR